MNPLVIQLIAALIASGPDMLNAVAALIKAAHGQPLSISDHTNLGEALAKVLAPKS